jgi:hypothetical protein
MIAIGLEEILGNLRRLISSNSTDYVERCANGAPYRGLIMGGWLVDHGLIDGAPATLIVDDLVRRMERGEGL